MNYDELIEASVSEDFGWGSGSNFDMDISEMVGQVFDRVLKTGNEQIDFIQSPDRGFCYRLYHSQDCCESVTIEDIEGSLEDLAGTPLVIADESSNSYQDKPHEYADSWTWTFYRFCTAKGDVVIRWLGESNGYYSESVTIARYKLGETP